VRGCAQGQLFCKLKLLKLKLLRYLTSSAESINLASIFILRLDNQRVRRRQWKSFDLQQQQGNDHCEASRLQDDDMYHPCDIDVFKKTSDAHFERLREDLAEEGNADSHLKMAKDLLADLNGQLEDEDEVGYRQEQAFFWTMKAAESGNAEAVKNLRGMLKENVGVSASNRAQVVAFLALTRDELIGQRIGKTLFKRLSSPSAGAFVSMCHLAEAAATGKMVSAAMAEEATGDSGVEEDYVYSTRQSERIGPSACVQAGVEYVSGQERGAIRQCVLNIKSSAALI
jgi:hypothetical protein